MFGIVSAIIGAVVGGLIAGIFAFWLAKREETVQYQLPIVLEILEIIGDILSVYAPEVLKTRGDLIRLRDKSGSYLKQLYLLWGNRDVTELQISIDRYMGALESFMDEAITREELESRRQHTLAEVRRLIERGVLQGAIQSRLHSLRPSRRGEPPPVAPS